MVFNEALLPRNLFAVDEEVWVKKWVNRWEKRIFPNDRISYRKEGDNYWIFLLRRHKGKDYEIGVLVPKYPLFPLGVLQLRADREIRRQLKYLKEK